jgi:hypothetical protein
MTTSEQAEYSIQVLISDWLLIDGTMDNHVQSAIDGSVQDDMGEEGDDPGNEAPDHDGPDEHGWDCGAEIGTTELPRVAQLGTSIRQAGWDQIPDWPHDAEGFKAWPAPGQTAAMTLTGTQWKLVVIALHYWADVDERLSDDKGAAKSRAIAAAVGQRLAEQGWSPEST